MVEVLDEPPEGADDWTEEQWREWLAAAPPDPETGRAHPLTRAASSPSGTVLGAAMFGLERAIYGERPKVEVVAEADADGLDLGDLDLDADDPAASRISLHRRCDHARSAQPHDRPRP
ncbi:MAG TPA: hypothetical protein VFV32_05690 [Acidimicrobiales bacterium]|nr:hypothetical protein [Acidimicrobiales bacterium]